MLILIENKLNFIGNEISKSPPTSLEFLIWLPKSYSK